VHTREWRFLVRRRVVAEWLAPQSVIPGTRTKLGAPAGLRPAGCVGKALGLVRGAADYHIVSRPIGAGMGLPVEAMATRHSSHESCDMA
jgi:hypothetical protein